mmetsp:Transcript_26370/g.48122  ORF Transcript_26370/g.48122 Transcript_26370/m.48122 type:complete len:356 (+) Transcript_26370:594-1661(+)
MHLRHARLDAGVHAAPQRAVHQPALALELHVVCQVFKPHRLAALLGAPHEPLRTLVGLVGSEGAELDFKVGALVGARHQAPRTQVPLVSVQVPSLEPLHLAPVAAAHHAVVAALLFVLVPHARHHGEAAPDPAPDDAARALVPLVVAHVSVFQSGVAHELALRQAVRALGHVVHGCAVPQPHGGSAPELAVHGPHLAHTVHVLAHEHQPEPGTAPQRAVDAPLRAQLGFVLHLLPRLKQLHAAAFVAALHAALRATVAFVLHQSGAGGDEPAAPATRYLLDRGPPPLHHQAHVPLAELQQHAQRLRVLPLGRPVQRAPSRVVLDALVRPRLQQEAHGALLPHHGAPHQARAMVLA